MVIIAAVAAGLFIAMAAVDWSLSRLEPERESRSRPAAFLAAGALCLVGAGAIAWVGRTPAVAATAAVTVRPPSPAQGELAVLEQHLNEALALAQKIGDGTFEPELPTIIDARRRLHAARLSLSQQPYPSSAASTLRSQSDILLGSAYQTLGIQWVLVKLQKWQHKSERDTATAPLKRELEKWYTIRDCLRAGRSDCGAPRSTDPKHLAITDFINWFHPYMVELNRFQESDIDLLIGSPEEIHRLRTLFHRARQELKESPKGAWDRDLIQATDALLAAADAALTREASARNSQVWNQQEMELANAQVVAAFEKMMTAVMEAR